jgi:hypothetical protein
MTLKIYIKNILIILKNTLFGIPYLFSNNDLEKFPKYPSLFMPIFTEIHSKNVIGCASILNKPGRGHNAVVKLETVEIKPLEHVFSENPKFITAYQILIENEHDIAKLAEFQFYKEILECGGRPRGMETLYEIEKDLNKRIKFYQRFRETGYRAVKQNAFDFGSEMQFAYAGSGRYVKVNSGNHRFAAVAVLKIKSFQGHVIAIDADYLRGFDTMRGFMVLKRIKDELTC